MAGLNDRPKLQAKLIARTALSCGAYQIEIERPAGFSFLPGQGIRVFRGGLVREYTLTNSPDDDRLAFCVQVVPNGHLSPYFASLAIGSTVSFSGPHGYFTLQSGARPVVFVATGTGIAPFVAMARAGNSGFTLLQGARHSQGLHYRSLLQPAAARYVGCVSQDHARQSELPWAFGGRVTEFLRTELDTGEFDFYVCGRREMVREVVSIVDDRFPGSRVFFEVFF